MTIFGIHWAIVVGILGTAISLYLIHLGSKESAEGRTEGIKSKMDSVTMKSIEEIDKRKIELLEQMDTSFNGISNEIKESANTYLESLNKLNDDIQEQQEIVEKRKKQIRSKLEREIYSIVFDIGVLFDIFMGRTNTHMSGYTNIIWSGNLTEEMLSLGLTDKCPNSMFLYDKKVVKDLKIIGTDIAKKSNDVNDEIERLFNFNDYLKEDEILVLEEIRQGLLPFGDDFANKNPSSTIGGKIYSPVNPSMSGYSSSLMKIYDSYKRLLDISNKYESQNRVMSITRMKYLYYNGDYKTCLDVLKRHYKHFPEEKGAMAIWDADCFFMLNQKTKALEILNNWCKPEYRPIWYRENLRRLLPDKEVRTIMNKNYSKELILELENAIERENNLKQGYEKLWNQLKEYYANKPVKPFSG